MGREMDGRKSYNFRMPSLASCAHLLYPPATPLLGFTGPLLPSFCHARLTRSGTLDVFCPFVFLDLPMLAPLQLLPDLVEAYGFDLWCHCWCGTRDRPIATLISKVGISEMPKIQWGKSVPLAILLRWLCSFQAELHIFASFVFKIKYKKFVVIIWRHKSYSNCKLSLSPLRLLWDLSARPMAHTCNPHTPEADAERSQFKAWVTQHDPNHSGVSGETSSRKLN